MQIKRHNIGRQRWHLTIIADNWLENKAFDNWMKEYCPECMCIRRWNSGQPYWEVRGGDIGQMMMIYMRWENA